jgi:hypothetical protein
MKKLALLALVALEICVCGCGNTPPTSTINTQTPNSFWEAELHGADGLESGLNFVTSFSSVEGGGTLSVTALSFINQTACFPAGYSGSGSASLITNSSDQVTGTLTFNVTGGSTLTLTGNLTGTSNGSTTTTGNLTNGVVSGTWSLTSSNTSCTPNTTPVTGTFLMCQASATCTVP